MAIEIPEFRQDYAIEQDEYGYPRAYLALRHPVTGEVSLMHFRDRNAHNKIIEELIRGFAPANAFELHLATAIAEDTCRLNRLRAIEDNYMTDSISDFNEYN